MQKVAKFEKVSFEQFYESMKDVFCSYTGDEYFKVVNHVYEQLKLPKRSTTGSAGYDFYAPFTFTLQPGEDIKIPTGIRVLIDDGWFLMLVPRSGLGFKYYTRLANSVAIIDLDYAQSDNEGHMYAKIRNDGNKLMTVAAGEAYMQGIFLPFGITYDDDTDGVRNGGFGSTDKR